MQLRPDVGPGRLALADTNVARRAALSRRLQTCAFEVFTVDGGTALLDCILGDHPDIVVSTERAAGTRILHLARSAGFSTPFIILDEHHVPSLREIATLARNAIVLDAPVKFAQLAAAIDDLAGRGWVSQVELARHRERASSKIRSANVYNGGGIVRRQGELR